MGAFGVVVMFAFAAQIHANDLDSLIDKLNSEEGMNTLVDRITSKLSNRLLHVSHSHQQGLHDQAMDGTTLLKPSRADLENKVQSAEANVTQAQEARKAAEVNVAQANSAKQNAKAKSAQYSKELASAKSNATQEAQEAVRAKDARQAAEANAAKEAQELMKAQSAKKVAETKASQEAQELTKAQSAKKVAEAKAAQEAEEVAKLAQEAQELTQAQSAQSTAESDTMQARSKAKTSEANVTKEDEVNAEDAQVDALEKSANATQASVITAGDTGIAQTEAMLFMTPVQSSAQFLPVAMACVPFAFVLGTAVLSRKRSLPSFPDASAGLLPVIEP
jgi:chromosome segregation ATPase